MFGLDITPALAPGRQLINGYGNGRFRIAGTSHVGSCLVFPTRTLTWPPATGAEITERSLSAVVAAEERVRILLIGCGRRFVTPPFPLIAAIREHGIVVEWMDTGAACRTFNVLLAEDRDVAAALIAVD